jgi:hypothetical protein
MIQVLTHPFAVPKARRGGRACSNCMRHLPHAGNQAKSRVSAQQSINQSPSHHQQSINPSQHHIPRCLSRDRFFHRCRRAFQAKIPKQAKCGTNSSHPWPLTFHTASPDAPLPACIQASTRRPSVVFRLARHFSLCLVFFTRRAKRRSAPPTLLAPLPPARPACTCQTLPRCRPRRVAVAPATRSPTNMSTPRPSTRRRERGEG